MPVVSRKGDKTTGKGKIAEGATTVFVNGIPIGLHTSAIVNDKHKKAKTAGGSSSVFAEGKPVLYVNAPLTCGHKISEGSPDVFVGN